MPSSIEAIRDHVHARSDSRLDCVNDVAALVAHELREISEPTEEQIQATLANLRRRMPKLFMGEEEARQYRSLTSLGPIPMPPRKARPVHISIHNRRQQALMIAKNNDDR